MTLVATLFVFMLGVGNFALQAAVLDSRHPLIAQLPRALAGPRGSASQALEFALLVVALLAASGDRPGWIWAYGGYTALNALCAWLILSRRV